MLLQSDKATMERRDASDAASSDIAAFIHEKATSVNACFPPALEEMERSHPTFAPEGSPRLANALEFIDDLVSFSHSLGLVGKAPTFTMHSHPQTTLLLGELRDFVRL